MIFVIICKVRKGIVVRCDHRRSQTLRAVVGPATLMISVRMIVYNTPGQYLVHFEQLRIMAEQLNMF